MKLKSIILLILSFACFGTSLNVYADSTRKERRLITKGNALYNEKKYVEAASVYQEALKENSNSAEATYNLALSQIRQVTNPADSTQKTRTMVEAARKNFSQVASMVKNKPGLAAKANFNLGNIEFNSKDFAKAIDYYKQALRIDPNDEKARKNLRIAQKNLKNQNQDNKEQNKNQENKQDQNNKNQDKKDQNQDQNKDQRQNQNNPEQNKPKEEELSQQAASQILQAIDNKENATRARVNKANSGEKSEAVRSNNRKW